MKGQAGIVYLILAVIILMLILPLSIKGFITFPESQKETTYKRFLKELTSTVDEVYRAGGGYREVDVNFPDHVDIMIKNHLIVLKINTSDGVKEVSSITVGKINGSISSGRGYRKISISYFQGDTVQIKG